MRNAILIAKREYLELIRGRAFRFSTILVPLLLLGMLGLTSLTGRRMGTGRHIAVAADSPALAEAIRANLLEDKSQHYSVELAAPLDDALRTQLVENVSAKSIDGLLVVEGSSTNAPKITYYSTSSLELMDTSRLRNAANFGLLEQRLEGRGMTTEQVQTLVQEAPLTTIQVSGNGETGKSQGMSPFYKAMLMTFLTTMPIILYGMDMARSIIEEKSSRIFEVMLSVARPEEILAGKLLGVGAVGLTQIAIWIVAAIGLSGSALLAPLLSGQVQIHFSLLEGVLFPIYFVMGFFLFSAFFSGLAATCETAQDLQMYISLAIVPTWASFAILPFLLRNPNSRWMVAASMLPPTSPLVMVTRLGLLAPPYPYWQIALSLAILAASIIAVIWFASRLYRIGILMYGKRATLPELMKWLRAN